MIIFKNYKKQIELLELAAKCAEEKDYDGLKAKIKNAVYDLFYESEDKLKAELVSILPADMIGIARYTLDFLRLFNGGNDSFLTKPYGETIDYIDLASNSKTIIEAMSKHYKTERNGTIFYSWQSDLPNSTNRSFLEDCIRKAIKEINKKHNLSIELDSDTSNVPGSPDIITSILYKIDNSLIFIGDVSIIDMLNNKCICNQNVMFEAGYALSSLSDERVILLCNTFKGSLSSLPFDLGLKRLTPYRLEEDMDNAEKAQVKDVLVKRLISSLEQILKESIGIIP